MEGQHDWSEIGRRKSLERELAFAGDYELGAGIEILIRVVGGLGAAKNNAPSDSAGRVEDSQNTVAGKQVSVDAEHAGRLSLLKNAVQFSA